MTFLQKTLGRNYKWWYVLMFYFKARIVSWFNNIFFTVGHLVVLTGTLATWWLASNKIIDSSLQQKWAYFLFGELFLTLIFNFSEWLGLEFSKGRHIPDLLKPQGYIKHMFFVGYGSALMQNLVKSSILILIIFGLSSFELISLNNLNFLALLMIPIGMLILYFLNFMVSCVGFYLPRVDGIMLNYTYLQALLMGRVFPLDLLFSQQTWLLFDPFAFTFYHPMQIYLGKYNSNQIIWVFVSDLLWCVLLYFLAKKVFQAGLKRNESVGL